MHRSKNLNLLGKQLQHPSNKTQEESSQASDVSREGASTSCKRDVTGAWGWWGSITSGRGAVDGSGGGESDWRSALRRGGRGDDCGWSTSRRT
jgi:hypothetical protein